MNEITEKILNEALDLSPAERLVLIERLLQSIDSLPDNAVDVAWAKEIELRIKAHDEGIIKSIPAQEVFDRLHRV